MTSGEVVAEQNYARTHITALYVGYAMESILIALLLYIYQRMDACKPNFDRLKTQWHKWKGKLKWWPSVRATRFTCFVRQSVIYFPRAHIIFRAANLLSEFWLFYSISIFFPRWFCFNPRPFQQSVDRVVVRVMHTILFVRAENKAIISMRWCSGVVPVVWAPIFSSLTHETGCKKMWRRGKSFLMWMKRVDGCGQKEEYHKCWRSMHSLVRTT